ncbi:MFS transporter [Brevibacterium senegalense]|uniref:MFS transporter n=1 Tax=Brevibacterium senegalense TaxID=1033736 RepID=UPI0002FD414F|nr:MFS transporter [Brevibacterium senegalense]
MSSHKLTLAKLFTAQLFSGAGIASGYAVGGLLAEQITGRTAMAGFAQMSVILGAGLVAYPLATLAGRYGRRTALTLGFGTGTLGAGVVLVGVSVGFLPLFMLGMMLCGSSTAAGLQARYAASDTANPQKPGQAMSIVIWATTVGSVLGPNFTEPGSRLGDFLGINPLSGPYLISMGCFAMAALAAFSLGSVRRTTAGTTPAEVPTPAAGTAPAAAQASATARPSLGESLRYLLSRPVARYAVITVITGQMIMTNVMVMTPVHMDHQHFDLSAVGIVVSIHILGMYVFSPVFGWMADRWGPRTVINIGMVVYTVTIVLGIYDSLLPTSNFLILNTALFLLGVGWSMFLIGGSSLLVKSVDGRMRVPLQGVSDSAMNLGGAFMAAFAGTLLNTGGFFLINAAAAVVLLVNIVFAILANRRAQSPAEAPETIPATVR